MKQNQLHIVPETLAKEVKFKMSCSTGKGGQNVNRVATKATLFFNIDKSVLFTEEQKETLANKLKNRIAKDGNLIIVNQETRSAERNKKAALIQLLNLLQKGLIIKKARKKLKLPKSVKERRLEHKKRQSEKKERRRKTFL